MRTLKKETGAKPVRSRRCKWRACAHRPLVPGPGRRARAVTHEPEDLPFAEGPFRVSRSRDRLRAQKNGLPPQENAAVFFIPPGGLWQEIRNGILKKMPTEDRHSTVRLNNSRTYHPLTGSVCPAAFLRGRQHEKRSGIDRGALGLQRQGIQ